MVEDGGWGGPPLSLSSQGRRATVAVDLSFVHVVVVVVAELCGVVLLGEVGRRGEV